MDNNYSGGSDSGMQPLFATDKNQTAADELLHAEAQAQLQFCAAVRPAENMPYASAEAADGCDSRQCGAYGRIARAEEPLSEAAAPEAVSCPRTAEMQRADCFGGVNTSTAAPAFVSDGQMPNTAAFAGGGGFAMPQKAPHFATTGADRIMAWVSLVLGVLFANFRLFFFGGVSVTVYLVVTFAVLLLYFRSRGFRQTRFSFVLLVAALLCSAYYVKFGSVFYRFFNSLLLFALTCAWICATTRSGLEGAFSRFSFYDMLNVYIVRPFSAIGSFGASVRRTDKKSKLLPVIIGIAVTLPLAAVLVLLLGQADAAFAAVLNKLFTLGDVDIAQTVGKHLFGILCGFYLFWRAFAACRTPQKGITARGAESFSDALHFVPAASVYAILGTVCAVYIAYLFSQSVYFFSAFRSMLPEGFSYAEYARRGFFELCTVSGINLAVIAAAFALIKKQRPTRALCGLAAGISVFTQLLIVTAIAKLAMYISEYGLTLRRLNAAWFMLVLFVLFALVEVKCARPDFKPFRAAAVTVAVMFIALCWSCPDSLITAYNISQYESGAHQTLDVEYIVYDLSSAALPQLLEYAQSGTQRAQLILPRVRQLQLDECYDDYREDWRAFNADDCRASEAWSVFKQNVGSENG